MMMLWPKASKSIVTRTTPKKNLRRFSHIWKSSIHSLRPPKSLLICRMMQRILWPWLELVHLCAMYAQPLRAKCANVISNWIESRVVVHFATNTYMTSKREQWDKMYEANISRWMDIGRCSNVNPTHTLLSSPSSSNRKSRLPTVGCQLSVAGCR